MIADPMTPGRGLPVYQPTTVVLLGTWSVPFRLRPRVTIGAFTPMAGMVSQIGLGACWMADTEAGTTDGPEGTATGDGFAARCAAGADEAWAMTKPIAPTPAASSPAPSIAADSSRACALQTADARTATRRRRAGGRSQANSAAARRHARLAPGHRRNIHKLTVVARIWTQDGSATYDVA